MHKLLIAILFISIYSCTPDKKLSGAYRTNQTVKGSYTQIIFFSSDSTLVYENYGKCHSSLKFHYQIVEKVLHVIFYFDQLSSLRDDQRDKISTLDSYPLYIFFRTTKWYFPMNIRHHKLVVNSHYSGISTKVKFIKIN